MNTTLKQKVADYIDADNTSDAWILGDSTLFYISKNNYQHNNFDAGSVYEMLGHCSNEDIQAFAIDEDITEETA